MDRKEQKNTKANRKKSSELFQEGELAERKIYQSLLEKINAGSGLTATELKQFERTKRKLGLESENGHSPDVFSSSMEVCEYLDISKRMLHYYIREGQIRQNPQGTFDKKELDKFIKEKTGTSSPTIELKKAELRYRKAKAEREEILVRQLKAQLIPIDEVERMFAERAYEISRSLLYLSRRIGHKLAALTKCELKEVVRVIDNEVYEFLENYSRTITLGVDGSATDSLSN